MSQDVTRLEELLTRVQRNAALPRTRSAHTQPVQAHSAPMQPAAPAVSAEPAFSPPVAAQSLPEPLYVPPASEPPARQFRESSGDLLDPFPASSAPPPPPAVEEEPVPPAPREHISGVMPVAELAEPPEELLEDDIVEMSPGALAAEAVVPAARADEVDLNFDEDEEPAAPAAEEEPPASSSRTKVAASMDEALANAADQMEMQEGREVPLKTPPPESGPQAAMALPAGIHSPPAPDIDELLEADILPVAGTSAAVPRPEQLGQTIDLEEARGPHLELDHPAPVVAAQAAHESPSEELEISLPQREFGGGYQEDLMPPPEARQDLDAHLQRVGDDVIPPPPESLAQYPSVQPAASTSGTFAAPTPSVTTESSSEAVSMVTIEAAPGAEFSPDRLSRPELSPVPVAKFMRADAPRPSTFLELLDSSLSLGRD